MSVNTNSSRPSTIRSSRTRLSHRIRNSTTTTTNSSSNNIPNSSTAWLLPILKKLSAVRR